MQGNWNNRLPAFRYHAPGVVDLRARFGDDALDSLYNGYVLMRDSYSNRIFPAQIRSLWRPFLDTVHAELYEQYQRLRLPVAGHVTMHRPLMDVSYARVRRSLILIGHLRSNGRDSARVMRFFQNSYRRLLFQRINFNV